MPDLSTKLAQWKSEEGLRGPIPRGLLARLETAHKAKEERIQESRTLTEESKRLEITEARRQFRQDWREMRGQVIEQFDRDLETARRTANPPASNAELERMGLLAGVYMSRWQRAPGNMGADVEKFAREGDAAGLHLIREHSGLLAPGARTRVLETVGKAEEALMTDAQRTAANQVRNLEGDRSRFELGTGMREGFIRARTAPIGPRPADPVSPAYPRPQR
jgi:hypothetical protein